MSAQESFFGKEFDNEMFLKGEYLKRHYEENADQSEIDWLKENCFSPFAGHFPVGADDCKTTLVRECIYKRDKETKGETYVASIAIPFDTNKHRKWITKLHKISAKYKMYAPDLLALHDFESILLLLKAGDPVPHIRTFGDEPNANYIYDTYGYRIITDIGNTGYPLLRFEIDLFGQHEQQDSLVRQLGQEILIFKFTHGLPITRADREYVKPLSDQDKSKKFRANALYNRAIGIYAWDMVKRDGLPLEEIRKSLVDKRLFKYNKKFCSPEECVSCASMEHCRDSFENAYKVAAHSITRQEMVPTSEKLSSLKPQRKEPFFQRVLVGKGVQ